MEFPDWVQVKEKTLHRLYTERRSASETAIEFVYFNCSEPTYKSQRIKLYVIAACN